MKKYNLFALAILSIAYTVTLTSCLKDEVLPPVQVEEDPNSEQIETRGSLTGTLTNNGSLTLAGFSTKGLTQDWWKYAMSLDCEGNPVNDGSIGTAPGKIGRVVFLVGPYDGSTEKKVVITPKTALLVPVFNVLKTACDATPIDPSSDQLAGQLLKEGARKYIDEVNILKATLDGRPIKISATNRIASDFFSFTGNIDLNNCTKQCVTGEPQLAVSDGYWLTFAGLTRGQHVLFVHGEIEGKDIVQEVTYYINVY